jgi:hypothetical protein
VYIISCHYNSYSSNVIRAVVCSPPPSRSILILSCLYECELSKRLHTLRVFFLSVAQQPNLGLSHLPVEVSRSHTDTHTYPIGSSERVISPSQSPLPKLHTRQTQDTNIHLLIGVRTRDLRNRAASNLRLKEARSSGSAFLYV